MCVSRSLPPCWLSRKSSCRRLSCSFKSVLSFECDYLLNFTYALTSMPRGLLKSFSISPKNLERSSNLYPVYLCSYHSKTQREFRFTAGFIVIDTNNRAIKKSPRGGKKRKQPLEGRNRLWTKTIHYFHDEMVSQTIIARKISLCVNWFAQSVSYERIAAFLILYTMKMLVRGIDHYRIDFNELSYKNSS